MLFWQQNGNGRTAKPRWRKKTKDSTINQTVAFKPPLLGHNALPKTQLDFFHRFSLLIEIPSAVRAWIGYNFSVRGVISFLRRMNKCRGIASREKSCSLFGWIHIFNGIIAWYEAFVVPANQEPLTRTSGLNTFIYFIHNDKDFQVNAESVGDAQRTHTQRNFPKNQPNAIRDDDGNKPSAAATIIIIVIDNNNGGWIEASRVRMYFD